MGTEGFRFSLLVLVLDRAGRDLVVLVLSGLSPFSKTRGQAQCFLSAAGIKRVFVSDVAPFSVAALGNN